jgi:hypothetical protein
MAVLKLMPLIGLISFQASTVAADNIPSTPMVDGKCIEYKSMPTSTSTDLGFGVTLFSFQNDDYVWFCYSKNKQSYGTLDLYIDAPNLPEPLNFHISAQLGEWPANKPDLAPKEANSDQWWEINGWWANVVSSNGMQKNKKGENQTNYKTGTGREIVLSKEHFGNGEWQLYFNIRNIVNNGQSETINHPEQSGENRQTLSFKAS